MLALFFYYKKQIAPSTNNTLNIVTDLKMFRAIFSSDYDFDIELFVADKQSPRLSFFSYLDKAEGLHTDMILPAYVH